MSNRQSHQRAEQRGPPNSGSTFVAHQPTENTGNPGGWGSPAAPGPVPAGRAPSNSAPSYPVQSDQSSGCGTDTDTSDDSGNEDLDINPGIATLPESQQGEAIYWGYRQHKRAWRRHVSKAPRRLRRQFKRTTRGRGGTYFGGGSKGHGKGGKGARRTRNPKDRNGNVMKCSICNSEEHLRRYCPQANSQQQSSSSASGS